MQKKQIQTNKDTNNTTGAHEFKNDLILKVLRGEACDQLPIWIMRQAGRYLPEYRKIRGQVKNFMTFCRQTHLTTEVALQPIDRFGLDAAIVFSDILTIPEAMGMSLSFVENKGPLFERPLRHEADFKVLRKEGVLENLEYVVEAVRSLKQALNDRVPLIGFSGSPWTLAAYMVEGSGSKQFLTLRKMMYERPDLLHGLLQDLSEVIILYLQAQIDAGADIVMLFDSWGGLLSPCTYSDFSLNYMQGIMYRLKENNAHIPIILFTKGGGLWLSEQSKTDADCIGIDWHTPLSYAHHICGEHQSLQGNLDPAILYGSERVIMEAVDMMFEEMQLHDIHRYVFNLGHGIYPDIDPEKLKFLIDYVRA